MQLPEWILEMSIKYHLIFLYFLLLEHYGLPSICPSSPSLSLSFLLNISFSHLFVGLRVIGELDSYFFSHHALILSHAAWLTGSWSARTELLITGTPHLLHQLHTHTLTHRYKTPSLYGWGKSKSFFFPSDSCDLCLLTKISKETRQGGIIPHDSFFSFTVLSLDTHIPCKDTHTYITYNNNTQTHTKMWPCAHALAHAHPLLCSHTVHRGVHSYRLRSLTDAEIF